MRIRSVMLALCLFTVSVPRAQVTDDPVCKPTLAPRATGVQIADIHFDPRVVQPAYPVGQGPRVLLDEAHAQRHTVEGRYAPFVKVLRRDGFLVDPNRQKFSQETLADAKILVVANARGGRNPEGNYIPSPSAFSRDEIEAVRQWVSGGGSLFLIVDHLPAAGGSFGLARAFGILLHDGYATDATCGADEFLFSRSDGSLADHSIVRGRNSNERIDTVRTITGTAFRAVVPVWPLLILAPDSVILMPTEPWQFTTSTPRFPGEGMLQGAALTFGRGRVVVFGEAAMFSAQVSGTQRRPMGMNQPTAGQNMQFLLNVVHWLSGLLPEK